MVGSSTLKMTTRFSFLLLIGVLFIVTLTSAQNTTSTSNIRRRAEADILKIHFDLSDFPIKETKASFRNASSTNKSELWRTHLTLFLVNHPELNERQKRIISTAISLATPEFFEVRPSEPAWKAKVLEPLRSLETKIVSAFSLNDGAKIFATLGDGTEFTKCSAHIQRADSRFVEQDEAIGLERNTCDCSTNSDWCPISGYCKVGNCSSTSSGCGTLWSYPCNGKCY